MSLTNAFFQAYLSSLRDALPDFDNLFVMRILLPADSQLARLITSDLSRMSGALAVDPSEPMAWTKLAFPLAGPVWLDSFKTVLDNAVSASMPLVKERLIQIVDNIDALYLLGNVDEEMKQVYDNMLQGIVDSSDKLIMPMAPGPVRDAMVAAFVSSVKVPLAEMWMRTVLQIANETGFAHAFPVGFGVGSILYTTYRYDLLKYLSATPADVFLVNQLRGIPVLQETDIAAMSKVDTAIRNTALVNIRKIDAVEDLDRISSSLDSAVSQYENDAKAQSRAATWELRLLVAVTIFSVLYLAHAFANREQLYRYAAVQVAFGVGFLVLISIECANLMKTK